MNTAETTPLNTIDLAEFKARCIEILERLTAPGVILTKDGHPIAQITPLPAANNEPLIGSMKDEITVHGDILSTGLQWDAQS
jgi:antitoxin (DNA-binding transcriptional repressor) of toxin-antitoxin stability system